jgi:hypothetical protein
MRSVTASATPSAGVNVLWVLYLVAGGIVSATHHFWQHVNEMKPVASAILATLLWPLLLVGITLHIH